MKIGAVIKDLCGGGAERVLQTLANQWVEWGHEVTIYALDDVPGDYPLDPRVAVKPLRAGQVVAPAWRLPATLWQGYRLAQCLKPDPPDALVGFLFRSNLAVILTRMFGLRSARWITEHVNIDGQFAGRPCLGGLARMLRRLLYPRVTGLICVSEGVRTSLVDLGIPAAQVHAIANPICNQAIDRLSRLDPEGEAGPARALTVVSMGRLGEQKDHQLLLRAGAPLLEKYDAEIQIVGQGELHDRLLDLARELGVGSRVRLLGWVKNPYAVLRRASLFAFPSRYEGFGMALVEAMACGLPVLSTDCPSGPAEILEGGRYGLLVPPQDVTALREALERLLASAELRQTYASLALTRARQFDVSLIGQAYLDLFREP